MADTQLPLNAALELVWCGWAVFPCKWTGQDAKAPLTVNGYHDASHDPELVRKWWTRFPYAMIGAPVPESVLVIDLDPRNNPACLADLEALTGPLPETLTAWSGRNDGGRHHYFLRPAGPLTSTRLPAGVDLKVNGYCIVPPSLHPATGQPYRWDQRPPVELPAALRDLLRPPPSSKLDRKRQNSDGNGDALVRWVASRTTNVNDAVYWAAKKAAVSGVLDAIEEDLVAAADHAARTAGTWTDAGERQTRKTIGSARMWVTRQGVAA